MRRLLGGPEGAAMIRPQAAAPRLRSMAAREGQRITRADVRLLQLAAELLDEQASTMRRACDAADQSMREACNSGALVAVVRGELHGLLQLLEAHA